VTIPDLRNIISKAKVWATCHPGTMGIAGAVIFYALCTVYYTGGVVANCQNSLTGGVGDNTAGLIWLNSINHANPLWGFTHITNYPYGEQLKQPVYASGAALYALYWMLAKVSGSVCGYNLLNVVGFMSAALLMYSFVQWLTRRPWIALLAGFAVAFTPYLQISSGVHPSYVFEGLFVAIMWIFFLFWRSPKVLYALALGTLTAITFYWDPYFVLIGSVLWVGLLMGAIVYELCQKRDTSRWKPRLASGAIALGALVLLLTPLAYVRLHYAGQIDQAVTASRNPIKIDSQIYAARPLEYLLPVATQPVLQKLIPDYAVKRNHHLSNAGEYTINISLTLLFIILLAAVIFARRIQQRRRLAPDGFHLAVNIVLLVACLACVGGVGLVFSFPPMLHGVRTPTWYLTDAITMWRVFARLYIIVNLSVVSLAAIGLAYLASHISSPKLRAFGWVIVLAAVVFEYQSFSIPRPLWSYSADVPPIYSWLHNNSQVHTLAEYPFDQPAISIWPTYYFSYQRITGKDMINNSVTTDPDVLMHNALRSLADPQTIPTLRTLGADSLVVHGVVGNVNLPGLRLIHYEAGPSPAATTVRMFIPPIGLYPIAVYHIDIGPMAKFVLTPEKGFSNEISLTPISQNYVGNSHSSWELLPLPGSPKTGKANVCTQISSVRDDQAATITQDGHILWSGTLTPSWQQLEFTAKVSDQLIVTESGKNPVNYLLHGLGCQ
jgi:hypothetical protein